MKTLSALMAALVLAAPSVCSAQVSVKKRVPIPCPSIPPVWQGVAVARLANLSENGTHFYTQDQYEADFFGHRVNDGKDWRLEGLRGITYAENYDPEFMGPVYRLSYKLGVNHLYTMDEQEKADLLVKGWVQEEDLGYLVHASKLEAFRAKYGIPAHHGYPWFRMLKDADHFYTISTFERDHADGYIIEKPLGFLF